VEVAVHLPRIADIWGKFRIRGKGDSIRTASKTQNQRNCSYVRVRTSLFQLTMSHQLQYEVVYQSGRQEVRSIGYGLLERILVYTLPNTPLFGSLAGQVQILALIVPCNTGNKDAAQEVTDYQQTYAPIVTDIRNITNVIGRVHTRGRWGIIDRVPSSAKTVFVEIDDEE
jgi:hypothetical protein